MLVIEGTACVKEYYMAPVSHFGISEWMSDQEHRINEAETVNVLLALTIWRHYFQQCDVNVWVDSATTKGVIANGYSRSKALTAMSAQVWHQAANTQCGIWVFRVPTKLNPADPLSRGDDAIARKHGFSKVRATNMPTNFWKL